MDGVMTFVNSAGKSFVDFAVVMLVQSSLLIIVLLGLELTLRKRVRAVLRYWLWMLILVKLVLPTTLSSPTGLGYWLSGKLPGLLWAKSSAVEESAAVLPVAETVKATPIPEVIVYTSPASFANTRPIVGGPREAAATVSLSWQGVVFLAWLAAVVMMALLLVQRMFFVRGLVAQSKEPSGAMVDMLERCREQLGIRRAVRLKLSPVAASPSICGLFRPTILVPQALSDRLDDRQLKSVLLHELAHIKRGDLWVSFIQTVLQIVYIYNALLWVANAIIRKIREEAVDEMVLVAMGEQAEDYPQTLLSVSKLAFSRPALSLRLIGVAESKKALISRIEYIAGRPFPKKARIGITGLIAVAVVAAILLPMAKAEKIDAEAEVEEGWGTAIEGVQCRLRPDGGKWQAGEPPTLEADIRNRGAHELYVVQHQSLCELWFDGRWYSWAGEIRAKSSLLGAGREYNDIAISLDERWVGMRNGKPLRLRRRHIVRVAFITKSKQGEVIRVHSNPVEIEILPTEAGSDSSIRRAEREDEARRAALGSFRRRISFIGLDFTDAPRTSDRADLPDLFEERPAGSGSYVLRDDVVAARHPEFWEDGVVYYAAQKKQFYIIEEPGHPGSGSKTFYGPFEGEPWRRFGMVEPRPAEKQYRFAIYLVVDPIVVGHRFDGDEPDEVAALEQLRLASVPLFTEEDIVEYDWNEHFLKLTPEAWKRLPGVRSVWGLPFVVVADDHRCYLGAFWGFGSSCMPKVPFIGGFRPGWRENKIQISPPEPIAGTKDPRNAPRVRKILEELGIAKHSKVPKAGKNAPVWGEPVDGLRCRWITSVKEIPAGTAPMVGMEIENVSDEEIFWQCREGTWLIRHPQAAPGTPAGTSPRFEVSFGEGVREATREEAQPRHEGSGSPIGYYMLGPGAKMIITAAYPYPLIESGQVEVEGFLHRENPGGGGGYFRGQVLRNVMTCPLLVLEVVGGIKKPVIEGLSVSVACVEPRVETADELELVVSIENNSGGELELDHSGLEDDFPIVTLDMASQESGPHFLCTKEGGLYGTGRVRKGLKNNENKSKTIHVSDCWRLYGGRPILSPGRYRVKAKVRSLAATGQLVETESQPIWVTISEWPWGEVLEGVRVRLRPDKAMFEAGEPVSLKADIYNGGTSEVFGQQTKFGICRLQLDNQFYAWGGGPVLGPPIKPGGQVNDIPIPLDNVWVGKNKLNLSPGKHVIRVYFVPQGKDDRGLSGLVVSNPVEITIIADEGANESGSTATIGAQLGEIVELSGWKPEMAFGDAIEELRNSVEPPLKIVVLWSDLTENADIEQGTQINIGPLPPVRLSFALELLLRSVSRGEVELGYIVGDGVITMATVDSLPSKLETRVYDIALLVGPPLPGGYGGGFYGQPGGHKASAEDVTRKAARANELAKLIQETIEPDSWCGASGEGEIQIYENRKLIVYQTREVHQKIEKLLGNMQRPGPGGAGIAYPKQFPYPVPWWQAVRAGEPNSAVQIESRFILFEPDANEIGELLQEVEDFEITPLVAEPNLRHYLLDEQQRVRLLKLIKGDPNCGMTAVPKVTVLSGESAALSIQTQTVIALPPAVISKILPKAGAKCLTFETTIPTGTTLSITPIISADKKDILLNLNVQITNFLGRKTCILVTPLADGTVDEYEQEVPQIETVSLQTRISIPDGATLLLAGQKVKKQDEQDGKIVEKDLLIFIRAEIVDADANDTGGTGFPRMRYGGYGGVYGPGRYGGYGGYGGGYGGGFGAYPAVPPVISKEPNSPDVNSARRR